MNKNDSPILADFQWTRKRVLAAFSLAEGLDVNETAKQAGISERTLYRWRHDNQFAAEVDRLTLMLGIALKAERIRIAKRAVRQMVKEEFDIKTGEAKTVVFTSRDLLDWLKYVQSETEGIKLDLTNLLTSTIDSEQKPTGDHQSDLPSTVKGVSYERS